MRSPLGETDVMGQHPPHPHPTMPELQTTQARCSVLQGLSHFIPVPWASQAGFIWDKTHPIFTGPQHSNDHEQPSTGVTETIRYSALWVLFNQSVGRTQVHRSGHTKVFLGSKKHRKATVGGNTDGVNGGPASGRFLNLQGALVVVSRASGCLLS